MRLKLMEILLYGILGDVVKEEGLGKRLHLKDHNLASAPVGLVGEFRLESHIHNLEVS